MDSEAIRKLNLEPRSDQELQNVHDRLLSKWELKARRAIDSPTYRLH